MSSTGPGTEPCGSFPERTGSRCNISHLDAEEKGFSFMYIVIVGCGRYGSLLANRLSSLGHSVVIIDRQENALKALSTEFSGFTITGNAGEVSVLRTAKIETADCLLSMCNEDTLNLMVTQTAKFIFGVPKVIAWVYKPSYESIFRKFGIEIISPIQLALEAFLQDLDLDREPENEAQ
jgi:trk system potassium uptake protein TrkA